MSELAKKFQQEKQKILQDQCRHPNGEWRPLNWRDPETSIPERIAAVAAETPHNLAVFDSAISLTYSELDQFANRIAQAILAARGPGQEAVALLVGLDAPALAAALGVMKAGKFYVAIEESFPKKRALQILEHAEAHLIIADNEHFAAALELAGAQRQVINLENVPAVKIDPPNIPISLDSPAILIYTSGSTGQPKGIVLSHRSAFSQTVSWHDNFHICPADRYANFIALAWGGSLLGVYGALCFGAGVGNFDLRRHSWQQLASWLQTTRATFLIGRIIVRQLKKLDPQPQFPDVRLVTMGGDTIFRSDIETCRRLFPEAMIEVGYGCAEAGRVTKLLLDKKEIPGQEIVPVGYPFADVNIHLASPEEPTLAHSGNESLGEIVIQSQYLADGYWRLPELTAEKFRSEGFWGKGRAYFTGDLGRILPDGTLQILGRKDFMVKIRGYQVFTNEIDALLLAIKSVQDVCVTLQYLPDKSQRLVAYLVVDDQVFPGAEAVHAQLKDLPNYMKPEIFEYLKALPKTATGKTDRQQLPLPKQSRANVTAKYMGPRNLTEEFLATIWGEILEIDNVGINDNFLELGGNSLQSIRIMNRVNEDIQVKISYRDFFEALTIAEMAAIVYKHLGEK